MPKLTAIVSLSARLGRNLSLVQAASGNTSLKHDGILWVKASGKWLADAQTENIFVPIGLDGSGSLAAEHPGGLRPSIETAMHLALPHAVVLHVHSVNAIAWAVRRDAPEKLAPRLRGINWRWIPHVPSGQPLAREIAKAMRSVPRPDVFVLGNHGLVVCGACCDSAEELLWKVETRLAIEERVCTGEERTASEPFTDGQNWRLPGDAALHALALDPVARRILSGGVLYPCQAIFLAPSRSLLPRSASLCCATVEYQERHGARPPFFIVEGRGVVLNSQITRAEYAMLRGLLQVVLRLDGADPVRYLPEVELRGVLNADAYRYRDLVESGARAQAGREG